MKTATAGVKVALLFIATVGGGYVVWKNLSPSQAGYPLVARFRDATGLPVGANVVVAGLPVGQVSKLSIDGRYARVEFTVRRDLKVWSSAIIAKKAKSLLGDNYLELDPGSPQTTTVDGTTIDHKTLKKDDAVLQVVEATSPDALMHRIEATLPNVDAVLLSVRDLSDDVRRIVNGPLASVATRVDGLIQKEAGRVSTLLEQANATMQRIDEIMVDVRHLTQGVDGRVTSILDNLDEASREAKQLVASAQQELTQTGATLRGKLDKLDGVLGDTQAVTSKLTTNEGTLGKLINDPSIAENVEAITDDAKGFLGTLFGLKTYVGLRSEYDVMSNLARHYVSVELHTRPDKYFLVEIERGPRGAFPVTSLAFDPTRNETQWTRNVVIEDGFRFTFQIAKRFSWLTLRYGLKESSGGVGADLNAYWWDRNLRFSVDAFDASFDKLPRVKIAAAFELFRSLYLLAGVDDLANPARTLDVVTGNTPVPTQFETYRLGRQFFLGGMLRFNDEDLAALLTVGGSALSGATK